ASSPTGVFALGTWAQSPAPSRSLIATLSPTHRRRRFPIARAPVLYPVGAAAATKHRRVRRAFAQRGEEREGRSSRRRPLSASRTRPRPRCAVAVFSSGCRCPDAAFAAFSTNLAAAGGGGGGGGGRLCTFGRMPRPRCS
ncbi:unnamed protein product, partial [Ectocarpus fasciculatus]